MIARHLTIHGHVQGVFYRDWTVKTAGELGLVGWVRNRRGGTVEAMVQGEEDVVERFVSLAEDGPPAAKVESVDMESIDIEPPLSGFSKHATV